MKTSTKITRAFLCLTLMLSMLSVNAFAAEPEAADSPAPAKQMEVPVSQTEANINGRQTLIKVFEVSPDTDPESLKEYGLVIGGYEYTLSSFTKETTTKEDTKSVSKEETVTLKSSNKNDAYLEALKTFSQTIHFAEEGYEGDLTLVASTIEVEETGRSSHGASDTKTKTYKFDYNDDSLIPATITVSGNTYKKVSVSWSDGDYGPDGVMPDNYVATVKYSRSWTYSSVDGYKATATYTGDVTLADNALVKYTVEYIGSEIQAPVESKGMFSGLFGSDSDGSAAGVLLLVCLIILILFLVVMASAVIILVATGKIKFDSAGKKASAKSYDTLPAETRESVSAGPEVTE